MTRVAAQPAQHMLPLAVCVICEAPAEYAYPGPYIPLEYPAREWVLCCARHRRAAGRKASWRRVRAEQEPRLARCGSPVRQYSANEQTQPYGPWRPAR